MNLDRPHILVVDDDVRLRNLLQDYLIKNNFRVTAAENTNDARLKMGQVTFDLLVLDLMMPGEDGLTFTRSIREQNSFNRELPILMLTAMGETENRIDGLEAGSDDYMVKPFEPRELVLRINSILHRVFREDTLAPQRVKLGAKMFHLEREELWEGNEIISLTSGEAKLLGILAKRPGTTFSREDLSGQLSLDSGERAIDVQVNRLRRKIEVNPKTPRYLQTVRGRGYTLRPEASTN